MNFPFFTAKRLRQADRASFSRTVYQIGVWSIALGLTSMIVAFAVLFGFKATVQDKLFSLGAHLRVTKFSVNKSYEETPLSTRTQLVEHYKDLSQIRHLQVVAHKPGILKTKEDILGVVLKGVGKDYDWALFGKNLIAGSPVQPSDSGYSSQIVISQLIANRLKLKVGDEVVMWFLQNPPRPRKLHIQGVYETGLEEFDNQLVIGDISLIQRLNNWGKDTAGVYEIYVNDFAQLNAAAQQVANLMTVDMNLEKVTDRQRPIFDWLILLDTNIVVFLSLILFVISFNMASILLVMMMERTPMIGLLKALGSTNWQIRKIFLHQGVAMIARGLLYGNAIGVIICLIQERFKLIPLDAANYFMNTVPIAWNWWAIVLLNLGTLALVSAVLLIPTIVITRIQPVKAIKFTK
ncbi:MAG: FtsX-like permease family protein [Spirosomataceae bacterium]